MPDKPLTTITVSTVMWSKLCELIAPPQHDHSEGQNECAQCDLLVIEAAIAKLEQAKYLDERYEHALKREKQLEKELKQLERTNADLVAQRDAGLEVEAKLEQWLRELEAELGPQRVFANCRPPAVTTAQLEVSDPSADPLVAQALQVIAQVPAGWQQRTALIQAVCDRMRDLLQPLQVVTSAGPRSLDAKVARDPASEPTNYNAREALISAHARGIAYADARQSWSGKAVPDSTSPYALHTPEDRVWCNEYKCVRDLLATAAGEARKGNPQWYDWTIDGQGTPNAGAEFMSIVGNLTSLLEMSRKTASNEDLARMILARIAHRHRLIPTATTPPSAAKVDDVL